MSSQAQPPAIEQLAWMTGAWKGTLGSQTVEESWAPAEAGAMATMIKLSNADGLQMIELIVIRQDNDTLVLHLRQFSPALELRLTQDMYLEEEEQLADRTVSFVADAGAAIEKLSYSQPADGRLQVDVTVTNGTVFTADLHAL